jgi:uncharacterized iron-regulated membrane protein
VRFALTIAHRWVGLAIAAFLFLSGITGAVISWDHELDEILNPHLTNATAQGVAKPSLQLAREFEARDPLARVTYVTMAPEPGHALSLYVEGRIDPATTKPFELGYNEVFVDPVSGEELGRREWGQVWPITRETFVSFLYKLHYSLHIPEMWGIDEWGLWLMGGVAILWTLDCFVGFYLTLPPKHRLSRSQPEPVRRQLSKGQVSKGWWSRWRPAWQIKTAGSTYRINFDIHRAFGLWTWGLLFMIAFTGFSLNLYREIFLPLMSTISQVTPTPFEQRARAPKDRPVEPGVSFEAMTQIASAEARRRGWAEPLGAVRYRSDFGMYDVRFFNPGDDHGAAGVGPPILYFDGQSGHNIGDWQPWTGTAADIFVQAQFPLHSGRILGLPGRIIVSVIGLVVAALSVTGVVIWLRKRRARVARRRSDLPRGATPFPAE